MALRTISICAGVGGLDLGVRIARPDARCVAFVEREASAAASLVASMEAGRLHPAAVWSDLRTFDAGAWRGAVDCVLSGDPCQGNSVAGKRLGQLDDRWLLDRAINVYDQSGAAVFFRENVPGNLAGQLEVAIPALERLGCRVAAGIFSAAEAGANHRRERFFILAHREGVVGRVRGGCAPQSAAHHADAGRCGGAVGNPFGCGNDRNASCEERRSLERIAADGAGDRLFGRMADAAGRGCDARQQEPARIEQRLQGSGRQALAGDRGGRVAHTKCDPCDGRGWGLPNFAANHVEACRYCHGRGSVPVAVSDGAGPQGRRPGNGAIGRQEPDGHARLARGALATIGEGRPRFRHDRPFAPGPADPVWAEIVRDAPALEPAVCRVAHGVAGRIERLRHCGNGVVPLTAALAWVRLHGLLADDPTRDAFSAADDRTAHAANAAVKNKRHLEREKAFNS